MAINRAKLGNKKYKQGNYLLQNPNKYIGQIPVKYRSSWEQAFCKFCDLNDKVIKWSAEFLEIPYQIVNNGQKIPYRTRHLLKIHFASSLKIRLGFKVSNS